MKSVSLAVGANHDIAPYIAQSTSRGENLINSRTDMSITVEREHVDVRSKRELWAGLQPYRYGS